MVAVGVVFVVAQVAVEIKFAPNSGRLVGSNTGAADLVVDQSGNGEGLIPDHFCLQAEAGAATKEAVLGVFLPTNGIELAALPIRRAHDHGFDEVFEIPIVFDEIDCQPIEKLRVTGVVGLGAEVFARFDQAGSEEVLPDAIDLHAGGEGMFFINEPSGQTEAVHFFPLWNGW